MVKPGGRVAFEDYVLGAPWPGVQGDGAGNKWWGYRL